MERNPFLSPIKAIGDLKITMFRGNGEVDVFEEKNLVVSVGRYHIADQLADQGEAPMSYMAIGIGAVTQISTDTALGSELHRKALTSKIQGSGADANKVTYTANWAAGEGTGALTEAGIFNSPAAGVMLTRTTYAVKNKGPSDSMMIQWTVSITG